MKVIVFDLKDTLVYQSGLCADFQDIMQTLEAAQCKPVLYSISEPWTYQALNVNADMFVFFQQIVLVKTKETADIRSLAGRYELVGMVGDGEAERSIAQELDVPFMLVQGELTLSKYSDWVKGAMV